MPFSLFLALKYLRPKRSFTSVVTLISVVGVVLGVAIIIIVRAVMTGFGDMWHEKILDFKPHITITPGGGGGRLGHACLLCHCAGDRALKQFAGSARSGLWRDLSTF